MADVTPDTVISDEDLKTIFRRQGIPVKSNRTEPFGNEDCPCGSEIRYDLCCGSLPDEYI